MLASARTLTLFFVGYYLMLASVIITTPITPDEAVLYFQTPDNLILLLVDWGKHLGGSIAGVRSIFLLLGMVNALLFYELSKYFFNQKDDRRLVLVLYLLLPGVITSSVVVNETVVISTLLLLFLYAHVRNYRLLELLALIAFCWAHWSTPIFYLAILLYAFASKNQRLFYTAIMLLLLFYAVGDFSLIPKDRSFFMDLVAGYAAVFSPLLFLYLFYALYRALLHGARDIVWYIASVALIASFVLALHHRVVISDFSAYIMIGVIVAVRTYFAGLRVRLRQFRRRYRIIFWTTVTFLLISSSAIVFHQPIYRMFGKENYRLFAPVYEPYDKAQRLKLAGKNCSESISKREERQMQYYGITKCF